MEREHEGEGIWEGSEGGKGREKCYKYILISKIKQEKERNKREKRKGLRY